MKGGIQKNELEMKHSAVYNNNNNHCQSEIKSPKKWGFHIFLVFSVSWHLMFLYLEDHLKTKYSQG